MRLPLLRLLIAIITLATYARLLSCDFTQWDDPQTVWQNPRLHPPTLKTIQYYWTTAGSDAPMGLYIPVTYTFWTILAKIAGIRPAIFHAANIALHILAALAMFELLRVLVRHDLAAFAGALLFALHPVQVESVAWVSITKDLLCGLLSLLALWQYTLYAEQRLHKRRHYTIGLLCFILAMPSSPTGIVVPLMAGAIDLFFLRRQRNTVLKSLWPWLVLMLPCAIWTLSSQPASWLSPLTSPPHRRRRHHILPLQNFPTPPPLRRLRPQPPIRHIPRLDLLHLDTPTRHRHPPSTPQTPLAQPPDRRPAPILPASASPGPYPHSSFNLSPPPPTIISASQCSAHHFSPRPFSPSPHAPSPPSPRR